MRAAVSEIASAQNQINVFFHNHSLGKHVVQQFIEQLPPVFRGQLLLLASENGKG